MRAWPMFRESAPPVRGALSCEDCFEQLDRYVELELAGSDADNVAIPGITHTARAGRPARKTERSLSALLVSEPA